VIAGFSLIGSFLPDLNLFHSWWFLSAGFMLMLNILVCTFKRWKSIKNSLSKNIITGGKEYYISGQNHPEFDIRHLQQSDVEEQIQNVLHYHGFRSQSAHIDQDTYITADKNRLFRYGSIISHFSLILFILAYLLGNYFGFKDVNFSVAEGAIREIGHDTNLSIQLMSFADEYYPDNTPRDYRSEVILYKNGQRVTQTIIRVNQPLEYEGIRIYQSFFGPGIELVISRDGLIEYQGTVILDRITENQDLRRYSGLLDIPTAGLNIRVTAPAANLEDKLIPPGKIAVDLKQYDKPLNSKLIQKGGTEKVNGLELSYLSDKKYSGFQVSHDPGNLLVWIASALLVLGMIAVFYFPFSQVFILLQSKLDGHSRVIIRPGISRAFTSAAVVDAVQKRLAEINTLKEDQR